MMLEKEVEAYLKKKIEKAGGLCWKFTSPGRRGVPDRICILNGKVFFVELKRPNARPRPDEALQEICAGKLRACGVPVFKVSSKEQVDALEF